MCIRGARQIPAGSWQGSQESPPIWKKLHLETGRGVDRGNANLQNPALRKDLWMKGEILSRGRRGPGFLSPKPTKIGTVSSHFPFCPVSHRLSPDLLIDKWSQQLNSHRKKSATKQMIRLCEDSRDLTPRVLNNLFLAPGRLL